MLGCGADLRERLAERNHPVVLGVVAHLAPARVIAVLLAPARVGQIQTSVHAGGIASLRTRVRVSSSVMGVPSGARNTQPSVPISRRMPAEVSDTYRSPAARADSTGPTGGAVLSDRRALDISAVASTLFHRAGTPFALFRCSNR